MANNNLKIELKSKPDKDGQTYYIGKVKFPGSIDCSKGVTFLIFVSDEGDEQMQIMPLENKEQ